MTQRITVCGGGNGSHAMAGDLANRGYNVTLFEHARFKQNIEKVLTTRTIELTDEIEATVMLDQVTLDAKNAVKDAEVIILPIPTYAQEPFFDLMLPFLHEDQKVIATTGNLGSIVLGNSLKDRGIKGLLVGETSTLPYIARMAGPGKVRVIKDKKLFYGSAFPADQNHEFIELVNSIYKNAATSTKDVVETALNNLNPVAHPVGLLLNAGSIESAQMSESDYYLYREGISPSVAGVIEAVERERLNVVDALGYTAKHLAGEDTVYNVLHDPRLLDSVGPNRIDDRYLTEDVPYGLVPLSGLAKLVGKKTPVIDALVVMASALMGIEYWTEGRSLERLGIAGLSLDQLKRFLVDGGAQN